VPKSHQKWDNKETAVEASRWALKAGKVGKGQVIRPAAALAGDVSSLNRPLISFWWLYRGEDF